MKYDSPNCCASKHSSQQLVGGMGEGGGDVSFPTDVPSVVFVSCVLCVDI